jgi:serine/threonine protein phosphatase PrpC
VFVLGFEGMFFSGSVGDSRAIIACVSPPKKLPTIPSFIDADEVKILS